MKLTKQRLREIIKEELDLSYEDELGTTEPQHATSGRTAVQRLLDKLLQRAAVEGLSPEDAAAKLGLSGDKEVITYIASLQGAPMLDNPEGLQQEATEDPDAWRDRKVDDAAMDGRGDGASGEERQGGYGHFQRYYDRAYDEALEKATLRIGRPKHDPLDLSPAGRRARAKLKGQGFEEGKVSGHRSEVTYATEKRGKSKKPEKKAYNKAVRAQTKRDLKK